MEEAVWDMRDKVITCDAEMAVDGWKKQGKGWRHQTKC